MAAIAANHASVLGFTMSAIITDATPPTHFIMNTTMANCAPVLGHAVPTIIADTTPISAFVVWTCLHGCRWLSFCHGGGEAGNERIHHHRK
jgi:hypothetical protein